VTREWWCRWCVVLVGNFGPNMGVGLFPVEVELEFLMVLPIYQENTRLIQHGPRIRLQRQRVMSLWLMKWII